MTKKTALRSILSFIFILLMMPLGHAFVVLMEHNLDGSALTLSVVMLGVVAIAMTLIADRRSNKDVATAVGAFGGVLVWGAWVEFAYISYARSLGVPPLIEGGEIVTKPEYLMMPSALPFAALTFVMMVYGGHTSWTVVRWLRRCLGIAEHDTDRHHGIWTLIEIVLLIWYAYLALLLMYDKDLLGDRHPITLSFAFVCLAVAAVLFVRQLRTPTWAAALRASIVTVCILWTFVEVMIRIGLFTEIWISPGDYVAEMILMVVVFVAVSVFLLRRKC